MNTRQQRQYRQDILGVGESTMDSVADWYMQLDALTRAVVNDRCDDGEDLNAVYEEMVAEQK